MANRQNNSEGEDLEKLEKKLQHIFDRARSETEALKNMLNALNERMRQEHKNNKTNENDTK